MRKVLTIAGSDSGGGAGIQADLKTFHQHGVYGTSIITLVTAQNTVGVTAVELLSEKLVQQQLDAVMSDIGADAAKTGALGSAALIELVAHAVDAYRIAPLVVDPVMISKHGNRLIAEDAISSLLRLLLPKATLVTPNLAEAEALVGKGVHSEKDMEQAARRLFDRCGAAVVVKGGHLESGDAVDVLFDGTTVTRFVSPRIATQKSHGTGCTFSAAIAARLAKGEPLSAAVQAAKAFVTAAIQSAPDIGRGYGPLNHWAKP